MIHICKHCGAAMEGKEMIIAVDFDGTVVKHEYPKIGKELDHGVVVLKRLVVEGHKFILFTMRSGDQLQEAWEWFKDRDIPLWGVNFNPEQWTWTESRKVYANLYIDDAALGCPINEDGVDWVAVENILIAQGILERENNV